MRDNIRFLRKVGGWSLRRLSEEAGVSVYNLRKIERGENFGLGALFGLCRFYAIKPAHIFLPLDREKMKEELHLTGAGDTIRTASRFDEDDTDG